MPDEGGDGRHELGGVDRLRQVHLEAALQGPGSIFGAREGGERRGGDAAHGIIRRRTDAPDELEAVNLRHPKVKEHDVGPRLADAFQGAVRRAHGGHLGAGGLEHRRQHRQRVLLVVHGQHAHIAQVTQWLRGLQALGCRVLPPVVLRRRVHNHGGQAHAKGRPLIGSGAVRVDRAAVQLHDVANDREPEPEPARVAGRRAFRLTEPFEDPRQEFPADADASVGNHDLDVRIDPFDSQLHTARSRGELHGVREQVPHDLLEAVTIAGDRPRAGIDNRLQPHAFRVRGGLHRRNRVVHDERQVDRLHIESELAGDDP